MATITIFDEFIDDTNSGKRKRLEIGHARFLECDTGNDMGIYINLGEETARLDPETAGRLIAALKKELL